MTDAAGDEGQGPPLHRLRAQAVRSRPAWPLHGRASRRRAGCSMLFSWGFPTEFSSSCFETSARVFRRYFGIYLSAAGDLDPDRDIGGRIWAMQSLDLCISAVMNCFWYRNVRIVVLSR